LEIGVKTKVEALAANDGEQLSSALRAGFDRGHIGRALGSGDDVD